MNKKFKSIIAILLSMVLIFSCIPMSMFAFAASDSNTYVIELPANDTTFEEGTPSSNWIKRDTANYTVAEEGHAGSSKSLYITTTDSSAARLYYKFKVRKDTEYTVRFYAKGSLTNGLQAALVPSEIASGTTVANAKFANTETVTHTLNGEAWQEFALVLPAQDTSSTASIDCYLYFHVNNKNNVKFYVDNLKVAKEAEMTATADANGTATVTNQFGGSTILYGDTVTFTATPDAGYTFDGWYDGDEKVSSDAEYAFSVNEEVNLTAKFKVPEAPNIIELPASDTTFEDGTPSSKWIKKDNAEYAVADGGHAGSSKSLHITSKSSGSAARLYYKFTVRKDTAYTIRFYAKGSLHSDNKLNTALLDHQISSGTVADNKIANTATLEQVLSTDTWKEYTLVLPVQDADSTATMDCYLYLHVNNKTNTNVYFDNLTIAKAVEVTATADANGTATVTNQFGGSTILYGDTVTFTATPDAGYAFDGWYDGDVLVSSNVAYTIDDITDSVSLVAKFLDRPINIATIVNSDFESEELDGWSINSNTTGTIVNTESHSGSNSLNLSFEGTGYKHTYLSLNVNANKEYKIRFYAKSNTASPCYLQVLHTSKYTDASNGGVVFINPFAVGNSAAWNEYYLTIPSDNPSEKIYLDFYSNNTSFDVYIDDITVAVEKNITVSTDISSDTNKGYVTFANQYGEVSETQDAVYLYGDTVTAIAHPDSANKLLGWKLSGANEYLSTEESYSSYWKKILIW